RPASSPMSWDFVIAGAEVPGEVTIDVKAFDLPSGTTLHLTDRATGESHPLVPGGAITLASHPGGRAYRIEAASNGDATPVAGGPAALRYAYPNPFRGSTGLTFSLPGVADIA